MKEDFSLASLHYHGLCTAIERDGVMCFSKKRSKGLCYKHYDRLRKHGSIHLPSKRSKKCKFLDCNNPYHASGACKKHYTQSSRVKSTKQCEVDTCYKTCIGKYCSMHRTRLARYGNVLGSGKKKGGGIETRYTAQKEYKICLANQCNRSSDDYRITKGLCPKHYQRWRKTGQYKFPTISIMETVQFNTF